MATGEVVQQVAHRLRAQAGELARQHGVDAPDREGGGGEVSRGRNDGLCLSLPGCGERAGRGRAWPLMERPVEMATGGALTGGKLSGFSSASMTSCARLPARRRGSGWRS